MSALKVTRGVVGFLYLGFAIAAMLGYDPTYKFVATSAFLAVAFHFGHLAGWDD